MKTKLATTENIINLVVEDFGFDGDRFTLPDIRLINVIIGNNGVGKTPLLDSLRLQKNEGFRIEVMDNFCQNIYPKNVIDVVEEIYKRMKSAEDDDYICFCVTHNILVASAMAEVLKDDTHYGALYHIGRSIFDEKMIVTRYSVDRLIELNCVDRKMF